MTVNSIAQKMELGKVTISELTEKKHPIDSSAVAAFLFNKAKTKFIYTKAGFSLEHEYTFRIKIYKKEGFSWANVKIPYYTGYKNINGDAVLFSDCVTYNIENGTVVKTKMKNEGSIDTKINENWRESTIILPNVKEGSVLEYKYTIRSENIVKFPIFNFQYAIPVNYAEYITEIPEFFIYKPIASGFLKINSDFKIGTGYQNFDDKNNQGISMNYKQINSNHIAEKIPALKDENYVDNIQNYRLSIDYELEKTRFPDAPEKNYTVTWTDVAENIYEDKHFGEQIKEHSYYIESLNVILKGKENETEKVNAIFKFVQNKMNWNNENSIFTDKGVVKAFAEETGNNAEINFILIAMLNHAGINANPVLISTKSHGIPVYPNRTVFNFVIASAEVDGKQLLMDATNKFSSINILPIKNLNWTGRLIRQDGSSEEINLTPDFVSEENINLKVTIEDKGNIYGKAQILTNQLLAFKFRENFAIADENNYIENLENKLNKIQIKNYSIENKKTDYSKPIKQIFEFSSNNEIEIINNKIYFSPLFFFANFSNPFQAETREFPIDFEFPKQKTINVSIYIPEGYEAEIMPKSLNLSTGEGVANFKYMIVKNDSNIQIKIDFNINKTLISQDFYDVLKDFYKQIIEKQNEKIVLVKK